MIIVKSIEEIKKEWELDEKKPRPIILEIRNNETGEIVKSEYEDASFAWEREWFNPFYFAEGNYSCDCNRVREFKRAKGISEEEINEADDLCGDVKYSMNIYTPEGELLYKEFNETRTK